MSLPPFPSEYRASGVLLHVTSLPSPYGIGDVGPGAVAWINRLHEAGQSWWQALPLGPTGYGNSPYQSLGSFAGNGLLISPDWLVEDGLLAPSDCLDQRFSTAAVDYDAVIPFKHRVLERAWANFAAGARSDLRIAFEQFSQDQADWLDDYALFRALKARYNGAHYLEWPRDLVGRVPAALAQARQDLADKIDQACFAQFLLFRQGARLRAHVQALRRTGYRWCVDRVRGLLAHVDAVRLDHFRGFAAAWHIPAGAPTAQSGQWVPHWYARQPHDPRLVRRLAGLRAPELLKIPETLRWGGHGCGACAAGLGVDVHRRAGDGAAAGHSQPRPRGAHERARPSRR